MVVHRGDGQVVAAVVEVLIDESLQLVDRGVASVAGGPKVVDQYEHLAAKPLQRGRRNRFPDRLDTGTALHLRVLDRVEVRDLLPLAVLENVEVLALEPGYRLAVAVISPGQNPTSLIVG